MSRYGKRDDVIVHEAEPFNVETGAAALAEGPLTATDAFYVRGHGAVPELEPARSTCACTGSSSASCRSRSRRSARRSGNARSPRRCSARATGAPG